MTNVCAFVEKYDSSNTLISRKWSEVLLADVTLAGERSLDTASLTLSARTAVDVGDVVKYVQDIVDTEFLYGIWNFQDSLRDESGYDQDGVTTNVTNRYIQTTRLLLDGITTVNDRKWLNFTGGTNDKVTITDSTIPTNVINFSGMFDIIMLIKPDTASGKQIFFNKFDGSTNGIVIGIDVGSTGYSYLELWNGGIIYVASTGSNVNLRDGNNHWIHLKRDSNNLVTLSVDGTIEYSNTITYDFTNSVANNFVIGAYYSNSLRYIGYISQTRIYCGGNILNSDYNTIVNSREQPLTMKFAGLVWKNNSDSATKNVQIKAHSEILPNTIVSPATSVNIYSNTTYDSITTDLVSTYLSGWTYIRDSSLNANDIIVSVGGVTKTFVTDYTVAIDQTVSPNLCRITSVTAFASGSGNVTISYYYYSTGTTITHTTETFNGNGSVGQVITLSHMPIFVNFLTNTYVANDTILSNILILATLENSFFYTTPRKTLIAESRDQNHIDLVFTNGKRFKITDNGKDITSLVNDLEVIGGTSLTSASQTFSGNGTVGQTFTVNPIPYSYIVKVSGVTKVLGVDYTMNQSTGVITTLTPFTNASNNVVVSYYYQGTNYVYRISDSASQLDNSGIYSKSITLNGIGDLPTLTTFAKAYINKYKNKNNRYTINAPYFVNTIRPNYQITANNSLLGLSGAKTIVGINYKYPQATTSIIIGDFIYDGYDIANQTVTKINQTYTTSVKTNNT